MNYFKHYKLIALLAIMLMSNYKAYAHATVTHSSLNDTPIAPNQPNQVELTFNSRVELNLSQIFLVSAGDKMQRVIAVNGSQSGQIIISIPALIPGEYALQLKIFAADGHFSENLIRFFVPLGIE